MIRITSTLLVVLLLATAAVVPATAAGPDDALDNAPGDDCETDDRGPGGDGGPPGFLGNLLPSFLSDLLGSLPVPSFLKSAVGAC